MEQIRVCTHARPGSEPVIRTVPWPKVGCKAALIRVGACGVCGTDLHILKGHWPKPLPWPRRSHWGTRSAASSSNAATNSPRTS